MKYWVKEEVKLPHGKIHLIKDRCKGCGFCIEFCPKKVLVESEEFNSKGYHPPKLDESKDKCIACGFCSLVCPEFAIYMEEENED